MPASPAWPPDFTPTQFARFRRLVDSYLLQHGFNHRLGEDGSYPADDAAEPLELRTLAAQCGAIEEPRWPIHIARELGRVLTSRADEQQAAALASYQLARPLLRLMLWPEQALEATASSEEVALRPWLPGLAQGLALQLDGRVVPVSAAALADWGTPRDEAFALGLRNVKAEGLQVPRQHPLGAYDAPLPGSVHALFDGPRFIASHALFVSAYLSEAMAMGALFIVPHDRAVIFHSIVDGASLHAAVMRMASFATRAYRNAPRPLSPNLYWWHEGIFEHLPISHSDEGMVLSPPQSFVDQVLTPLNALSPD